MVIVLSHVFIDFSSFDLILIYKASLLGLLPVHTVLIVDLSIGLISLQFTQNAIYILAIVFSGEFKFDSIIHFLLIELAEAFLQFLRIDSSHFVSIVGAGVILVLYFLDEFLVAALM